jgi:predicted lysophospholipase L1 biosynthesis ABC-type transport system permease subunit
MAGATAEPKPRLPLRVHLMCGWPLLLVAIGGAIGGALGGLAYAGNLAIYKSHLAVPLKIVLNVASGLAAIIIWLVIAAAISSRL